MSYFLYDIRRYTILMNEKSIVKTFLQLIIMPEIWFLASYRSGRWVRQNFKIPVIRFVLKALTMIIHLVVSVITGISIPFETKIGRGLHISHFGSIIINAKAEIGEFCNIGNGLVIGEAGRDRSNKGVPMIGNFVYIGVGAKIIGNVKIGDHVAIGANAVVTKDLPENATAVGIPARIINYKGSADFIKV